MNSRAFTLSIVVALMAIYMAYSYIEGEKAKLINEHGNLLPVVVAKVDIKELEIIDDTKVEVINIPQSFAQNGHFKNVEEVYNTIAAVPILKGEQISKPRITYPGAQSGLSRQISIGKRALSIRVSENQAVSKLIKPGDRVDILALLDYAGGRKDLMKVKTILQDVLVLSTGLSVTNSIPMVGVKVDQEIKKLNLLSYTNFNTVTLELTPYEVQKVLFLNSMGSEVFLSLRNNDDKKVEPVTSTQLFDVLDEEARSARKFFQEKSSKENKRRRGGS